MVTVESCKACERHGLAEYAREAPVVRKKDLARVDAVCHEFNMDAETRFDFRDYLHECKQSGDYGSSNDRGDFTVDELRLKAKEFLGLE